MKTHQADFLPAILALSAVLPYLLDLGYRVVNFETLIISASVTLFGVAVSWLFGGKSAVRDVFVALLVYWILDGYFISSFAGVLGVWLAIFGGFAVLGLLQGKLSPAINVMLLTFSVFWLSTNLLLSSKDMIRPPLQDLADHAAVPGLAPIVHIVLDEQMSPEALPDTIPSQSHAATRIISDYRERNFDVYTSVWASHHLTHHSLSETFSLTYNTSNFTPGTGPVQWRIRNNDYMVDLVKKGYQVNVVQSNYLDICANEMGIRCHTYSRSGNGRAFTQRVPSLYFRLELALLELHNYWRGPQRRGGIFLYGLVTQGLEAVGLSIDATRYILQPAAMLEVLEEVAAQMKRMRDGQAFVVHLLLPHVPYVMAADCSVNPTSSWSRPGGKQSEREVYAHYWNQAACAHLQVMKIVRNIREDAIVIVHGDHGARITWEAPAGRVAADMYQTMVAVRHGKSKGRKIPERMSLPKVFYDVFTAIEVPNKR